MHESGKRTNNFDISPEDLNTEYTEIKVKKLKTIKTSPPVYKPDIHPVQVLNELLPNLEYTFESHPTDRLTFTCKTKFKQHAEITGVGSSKKIAKKNCAFLAICHFYPESFKPPQEVIESYSQPFAKESISQKKSKDVNELINSRLSKMKSNSALKYKNPSQLLHELCPQISNTHRYVGETFLDREKSFIYEYRNILLEGTDQISSNLVTGIGKSKKEAKNNAAKNGLREFLGLDIDSIQESIHN